MNRNTNKKSQVRLLRGIAVAVFGLVISATVMSLFPDQAHLLALIVALLLIYFGLRGIAHYSRAEKWLPLEATICSVGEDWIDVSLRYSKLRYFYPIVEYEYCFNGNDYKSDSVSFEVENIWVPESDAWGTKTKSGEKFWTGWRKGESIIVYVNPENPTESVVINKIDKKYRSQNLALIAGGVLIGFTWLCLWILRLSPP